MVRNQARSARGRSAVARRAIISGNTNGMMPQFREPYLVLATPAGRNGGCPRGTEPWTGPPPANNRGLRACGSKSPYFGGSKKGGSQPSATAFMKPPSTGSNYLPYGLQGKNILFRMLTPPGPPVFGFGPHA